MENRKKIEKNFVLQQGQSDCGVACLLSLIKLYGGTNSLERLRELSGTNKQGTTLLGLYQAANNLGFEAQGCEADIKALIEHAKPVILHVILDEYLQHYVVCYAYENEKFIVGDPAKGIVQYTKEELGKIWKSNKCLTLEPNERFIKTKSIKTSKKSWMLKLIKDDLEILSLSLILGIVIAVLGMAMAVFSQKLIDDILPTKDLEKLFLGIALVSFLLIIRVGLSAIRQFFLVTQGKSFNNRIIKLFYDSLLYLPKFFFDTRKIGELTARLNDTNRIQQVIGQIAGDFIINSLVTITSIIFLYVYSWQIGTIAIISLPVYFYLVYRHNKKIILSQKEVMSSYAQSESNYVSTMQGIAEIKNYNKQGFFGKINQTIYGNFQDKMFGLGKIGIKLNFISGFAGVVFLISILTFGVYKVHIETLQLGELMAILGISSTLIPTITHLALVAIPLNEAKVAFERMFEFVSIDAEDENQEITEIEFQSMKISNLSFRFPGRKQLLKHIDLRLNKNELIAIVGESGCGKSTFCQILEKFYKPETGEILINESLPFSNINTKSWRDIVSVVPQDIHIFNGSVLDNICLGDTQNEAKEIVKFCREFGFERFIALLPQGYATIVGEEGINLSGGQKQIIALARALYKKPQLLILDEATAAMDRETEKFSINLLKKLKSQITVIFISHRLHILHDISERIYVFEEGLVAAKGNHQDLLLNKNLYSEYWSELNYV